MEDPLLPQPIHHEPADPALSLDGLSLDEAPLTPWEQAESIKSRASSPKRNASEALKENPFDSEGSRILFDAMDQLQSCIGNLDSAEIDIPQLVICGGQSTGKSSLLQSLTDIPFPADTGCCTRFATRIVSRRTPAYSANKFKITIVEPDIKIDGFGYPPSDLHKDYVHAGENLSPLEFLRVMEDVTTKYMGIVKGQGPDKKNFATQVLRIELSGPSRSHFSILDVPGVFSSSHAVNPGEMEGVKDMVVKYMKKPENIVICVADAMTDLACQETFNLAARHVERKRLVSVFTKCDLQPNPSEVVAIVTGKQEETARFLGSECFVVRNRTSRDDGMVDLAQLEGDLFGRAPWTMIPRERRGSAMLRAYLSQLLCRQISDRFPVIQAGIQRRLASAQDARHALGHARTTHQDNKQYLMNIVQRYENLARKSLEKPGQVDESMRLRGMLKDANEGFAKRMHKAGHLFEFENATMDAKSALAERTAKFQKSSEDDLAEISFTFKPDQKQQPLFSPPVTPQKEPRRPLFPRKEPPARPSAPIFEHIRATSRCYQSTQLPGLINPDVLPDLFLKQTEKWPALAEAHLDAVATHVSNTVLAVLQRSCPGEGGTRIAHDELRQQLNDAHKEALKAAREKVELYCHQERASMLQTTDPRFLDGLRALRTIRLLDSLDALQGPGAPSAQDPALYFDCLHYSMDDNMVKDVHDVLKVYYQISIEGFIRHVTHIIIEQFVNDPEGPLRGLSRDWVYALDEEAVWKIAREDKETLAERRRLEDVIEKLQRAQHVSDTARARVASLEV